MIFSLSFNIFLLSTRYNQRCLRACSGIHLSFGSIFKHLSIKSIISSSSPYSITILNGNEAASTYSSLDFVERIKLPFLWKNLFLFFALFIISSGGRPIIITNISNSSYSSIAGKMGLPIIISANIQPKLHISADAE